MKAIPALTVIISSMLSLLSHAQDLRKSYLVGDTVYLVEAIQDGDDLKLLAYRDTASPTKGDTMYVRGWSEEVTHKLLAERMKVKPEQADQVEKIVRDLRVVYDKPVFRLTGTGLSNYTTSAKGVSGAGAAAGFGVTVDWKSGRRLNVIGTVTQSKDTVSSESPAEFAETILVPGIRKFSIMGVYRELYAFKRGAHGRGMGWGCYVNATPVVWKSVLMDTTGTAVPVHGTVTPFTVELYASYTLLNDSDGENSARVTLDYGFTFKYLGDNGMTDEDQKLFLGSTQDKFFGLVTGLSIRYASSHIYFYGTYLAPTDGDIPGLTGPQLQGGIALSATIASLGDKK